MRLIRNHKDKISKDTYAPLETKIQFLLFMLSGFQIILLTTYPKVIYPLLTCQIGILLLDLKYIYKLRMPFYFLGLHYLIVQMRALCFFAGFINALLTKANYSKP